VAGGQNAPTRKSAELYDPATGTWTVTGSLNIRRLYHTATLLASGEVLVAGGYINLASAELYDPASGIWTLTGRLNTGRDFHTATLLADGRVLVAGRLASAELYDPGIDVDTKVDGRLPLPHFPRQGDSL
jgi:hypothetical protein